MEDGAPGHLRFPFEPPAPGAAVKVAEGVLWLRLPAFARPDHVNVYALDDGDGWTIVDAGLDDPPTRAAWGALLIGPLAGRPVRRLIVTHHHPDHVGLAGWFRAALGAETWITRTAWLYARMLSLDVQDRPTPEALAFWRAAGMAPDLLAARAGSRPVNYADMIAPLPLGFRRIAEGDEIDAGGRRWRVAIGDGHAPEHATLWGIDHDLVLAGDQILPGITPNLGVYASEPDADPVGAWNESCRRLADLARPEQLTLPGHGRPFLDPSRRLAALLADSADAGERLLAALDAPRSAAECFDALYRRPIGAGEYGLALAEAVGRLNHDRALGLVERAADAKGVWRWRRLGA